MFLSDADQLREARAFSAELESNVRRLARERDEARRYAEGRDAVVADLQQSLVTAAQARDEARAELVSTAQQLELEREHSARLSRECQERHDELRAEVERLERLFQQTHGVHHSWVDARHKVAERQREACAKQFEDEGASASDRGNAEWVRKTPLVTEGEP